LGDKLTGGFLGVTSGTVVGIVVVAIGISLRSLHVYYNKAELEVEAKILLRIKPSTQLDEPKPFRVAGKTKPAGDSFIGI
jgi:hypothetical protein